MGKGWRCNSQGQLSAGAEAKALLQGHCAPLMAVWPCSPHHPHGVSPTSPKDMGGDRGTCSWARNPPSPRPALPPSSQGTRAICHPAQDPLAAT